MNRGGEGESTASSSVVPTDRNRKNSLRSRCRQQITGSSQLNFSEPADVSMSCLPFSKPWMPGNQFEAGSPMCTSLNSVTHLACLGFELLRKVHFGGSTQVGVSEAKADLGYSPYHVHILQIDLKLLSHFVYLSWYSPRQEHTGVRFQFLINYCEEVHVYFESKQAGLFSQQPSWENWTQSQWLFRPADTCMHYLPGNDGERKENKEPREWMGPQDHGW